MPEPTDITSEYERDISQYYGDDKVTAIITLRVDTKSVDQVARTVCEDESVRDVYLVTGDTDLVVGYVTKLATDNGGWLRVRGGFGY